MFVGKDLYTFEFKTKKKKKKKGKKKIEEERKETTETVSPPYDFNKYYHSCSLQ